MSTNASSSFISPTADIFNQPSTDFALLERPGVLSERYRLRLPKDTQEYVLELTRLNLDTIAEYVANCCTRGMLLYRCPSGDYGEAVLHTCHDPGCRFCGRGYSRLLTWARTHDIDRVTSEHIQVIELVFTAKEPKHRRLSAVHKFIKFLGAEISTLTHDVVDPSSVTRVRMAIHGRPFSILRLRSDWQAICPGGWVNRPKEDKLQQKMLEWVFAGLESMLLLAGIERAHERRSIKGTRLIRTTGRHFRPMTKPELADFNAAHAAHQPGDKCPKCRLYEIERIPPEQRITMLAEEVEKECDTVKWGGGISPFEHMRVTYKGGTSDNFRGVGQLRTMPTHSPPS